MERTVSDQTNIKLSNVFKNEDKWKLFSGLPQLQLIFSRNVTGLSWEVVVSRSLVSFTTPLDGSRPRPIRWLQEPDRRADAAAQRHTHSGCDQTGFNGLLSFSSSVLPAHGEPYQPPQLPGSAPPSASILGALLPDPEEHAGRRRRHPVRTETHL